MDRAGGMCGSGCRHGANGAIWGIFGALCLLIGP